jgi:hypothetical protein
MVEREKRGWWDIGSPGEDIVNGIVNFTRGLFRGNTPAPAPVNPTSMQSAAQRRLGASGSSQSQMNLDDFMNFVAGPSTPGSGGYMTGGARINAPQIAMPNINLPAAPTNMANQFQTAAQKAYQPMIDFGKSVTPYYEKRQEANSGEIRDLRNIAEQSWVDTAGRIRTGAQETSAAQSQGVQDIIGALEASAGESQGEMQSNLERLGLRELRGDTDTQAIQDRASESQATVGAEGSLVGNMIAEQSSNAANYADTIAGIQDTAAAADIALLQERVNELIFRNQGRIAQAQQTQGSAMLEALMQGQNMYNQQYGQYAGMLMDKFRAQASVASQNADMQMQAARFNAENQPQYVPGEAGAGGLSPSERMNAFAMFNDMYGPGEAQEPSGFDAQQQGFYNQLLGEGFTDTEARQKAQAARQLEQAVISRTNVVSPEQLARTMADTLAATPELQRYLSEYDILPYVRRGQDTGYYGQ